MTHQNYETSKYQFLPAQNYQVTHDTQQNLILASKYRTEYPLSSAHNDHIVPV